jgi:hypothetical protein
MTCLAIPCAFERLARRRRLPTPVEVAAADAARRRSAALQGAPSFPPEWGRPVEQYWTRTTAAGEQLCRARPDRPHLTVWRFKSAGGVFEATALFDRWSPSAHALGLGRLEPARPPSPSWEFVGPTTDASTLFRRPFRAD